MGSNPTSLTNERSEMQVRVLLTPLRGGRLTVGHRTIFYGWISQVGLRAAVLKTVSGKTRVSSSLTPSANFNALLVQRSRTSVLHADCGGLKVRKYINNLMNYKYIYDSLINTRLQHPAIGYTERHHILPKSMGGDYSLTNIVILTGREHWIAHLLLFRIYKNKQMAHACHMMAMRCEERGIPHIRNSRMYEAVRKMCLDTWRANGKKRVGKFNGSFGTMWISNIELKENSRISNDTIIPKGWVKGRSAWNKRGSGLCKNCGKSISLDRMSCSENCRRAIVKNALKGTPKTLEHVKNVKEALIKRYENTQHHTKGRKRDGLRGKFM